MTRVIDMADTARRDEPNEFQGYQYDASVSFIVVDASPGSGPKLHKHPYEEVFVVQEGNATFTAGDEVIEVSGGQVVVVPAGVAHKFVNSGAGRLRQVDIHASERFVTEWAGPRLGWEGTDVLGIAIRLGAAAYPYDTLTFTGTVASVEDGIATIDVTGSVSLGDHVTGTVKVAV